jgi:aspartyl-tRNA(Asn)/glutamyl-tRNA(Gln) amidotransferase subunit B
MSNNTYETVIGLEVHIQLNAKSKAFCADDTTFGMPANSQISAISLAHPGTLPFFNKKQLESAVRLGLAIGGKINRASFFDRKNYFYADLPKGFQTTQDRVPVCSGGSIELKLSTGRKKIDIHHFHMEEDAGKSIHDIDTKYSLVDLNRSGISLVELVTEPDFRSAEEVSAFMTEIRRLVRWLGISDGNMEEGSLRCDVNLSIRKFGQPLGTRCEMKNINSMRFARKAIEFEAARQIALLENGEKIIQQTRSFNPATGETAPLRDKEDAHDYRYFPEPDLPPILISENLLETVKNSMPEMPWILADIFEHKFGLNHADSDLILSEISTAHFFQKIIEAGGHPFHKKNGRLKIIRFQ